MQKQSVAVLLILLVVGGEASQLAQPVLWSRLIDFERFIGLGETAFINEYVDTAIPTIRNAITHYGLDPMPLPDHEEGFSVKPVLITYSARVTLTNGQLTNMVSVRRSGDAVVSYFAHMLRIRLQLAFDDLEFNYNYAAKVMELGPTGGVVGSLSRIEVVVDLLLDFNNDELHIQEFTLDHWGLRVRVNGNILIDWFVSPLVGLVTALFNNLIMGLVKNNVYDAVQDVVGLFNARLKEVMESLA